MLLAAAGLLHDIGKWGQRADLELTLQGDIEHNLCPADSRGRYTHRHVLWTYQAISRDLAGVIPECLVPRGKLDALAAAAARHHNPTKKGPEAAVCPIEEYIIRQADMMASGMERFDDEDNLAAGYKNTLLRPIFLEVDFGSGYGSRPANDMRYRLAPLATDDSCLPAPASEAGHGSDQTGNYRRLWGSFLAEAKGVPLADTPSQALDILDGLLARYTWCIPSATNAAPDVPLYDHLRCVGALAEVLYRYYEAAGNVDDERAVESDPGRPRILLVGGDLSGIQRYIFRGRTARGQARELRARSFLLSALTRAAASLLLDRLKLPNICLFLEAGGKFAFFAPATKQAEETLSEARRDFAGRMAADFLGELSLNIAWVRMSPNDFQFRNYACKQEELAVELERAKISPLDLRSLNERLFVRNYPSAEPPRGEELSAEDFGPAPGRRALVDHIGRKLVKSNCLVVSKSAGMADAVQLLGGLAHIGLLDDPPGRLEPAWLRVESYAGGFRGLPFRPIASHVPAWRDADEIGEFERRFDGLLEGEGDSAREPGNVRSFADIAVEGIRPYENGVMRGRNMLGILKADVDRLGLIFSRGLGGRLTPARHAALSRMLDFFFGGRLMRIVTSDFPLTYTVYAGGDDLLLAGPWDSTVGLAGRAREEFTRFVCGNPDITLSAAVIFVGPKTPLRRAASSADERLDEAKDAGRNRIWISGRVLPWNEYSGSCDRQDPMEWGVERLGDWIARQFAGAHALPMSFLRQVLVLSRMAARLAAAPAGRRVPFEELMWVSKYRYQLARNVVPRLKEKFGEDYWRRSQEGAFWIALGGIPAPPGAAPAGDPGGAAMPAMARAAAAVEYAMHRLREA
ncbi:MAG: hypothetical protein N3A38_09740 [Planctomycetota bacterium]|nr:hypothetical protein [Planctomycetota bacterium]